MKKLLFTVLVVLLWSAAGQAAESRMYEITITNITKGQTFTPVLAATHRGSIRLFELGDPAIEELADLAESGATGPYEAYLLGMPDKVDDVVATGGLLGPGESVTIMIESDRGFRRFSLAAMLIPTNDTFFAINNGRLPHHSRVFYAITYDSGSEVNDETCASIPGPFCGGEGAAAADGEGFVHVANGIAGIDDLGPETFDWRGPVARVAIRRMY